MAIRQLSSKEIEIRDSILDLSKTREWEFSGILNARNEILIELKTEMLPQRCEPSADVHILANQPDSHLILHHNHLTKESLSSADWNGACYLFKEIFAHCDDGTTYYGKVKDKLQVLKNIEQFTYQQHLLSAGNLILNNSQKLYFFNATPIDYAKETINNAMKIKGYIEYDVDWGAFCRPCKTVMAIINGAANDLAARL